MRGIDLEARVITAIDQMREGRQVENDFIECKREWPSESKARQLAASLNRAAGDPVIYIIGIDEKTGVVLDVSDTDVLDWWNQILPRFDQTPPEMTRHMNVAVGPNGDSVTAVAISSDRAPYVVKTGVANPSLEVPMREGTGTRSARRDELLRLLIPTIKVPSAVVLDAGITARYYARVSPDGEQTGVGYSREEAVDISGSVRVFFEHSSSELVTLPAYGMRGRIRLGSETYELAVTPNGYVKEGQQPPPLGVTSTYEWLLVTGPGAANINLSALEVPLDGREAIRRVGTAEVELELDIIDAVRPLLLSVRLARNSRNRPFEVQGQEHLGEWNARHSGLREQ
jgi:hypothetical protein